MIHGQRHASAVQVELPNGDLRSVQSIEEARRLVTQDRGVDLDDACPVRTALLLGAATAAPVAVYVLGLVQGWWAL